jgi:hypothetical protein
MSVTTYSLKKDGSKKLSANFKVSEFACKDGSDTILISSDTVEKIQNVRDYFGKPVTINSAYRTATHNASVGGATGSQHVKGTACDIVVEGVPSNAVASYLEAKYPKSGIGLYNSFTHIDSRGYKSYWINKGTSTVSSFNLGKLYEKYKAESEVEDVTEERVREIVTEMLTGKNTTTSSWAKDEVSKAVTNGITDGTRPQGYAKREEVVSMIVRAMEK